MEDGEKVKPETDEEKLCFQLIKDLLISFLGALSWFITFTPADNKHPICLYYADTQEKFSPLLKDDNEQYRLIANNPLAGAWFFHFVCEMFIKHVLGVDSDHNGVRS